jgi:multidrug efflux pump subunit AcrA (membrane-fusion protein)
MQHVIHCTVAILILAAGVGAMLALGKSEGGKREDSGDGLPEVTTQRVLPYKGPLDIEIDGIVTPFRDIEVAAEVGGQVLVKAAACRAGNFVRQGDLLVAIDPEDYNLEVDRCEKQKLQADAELEELEVEISNVRSLMEFAAAELKLNEKEWDRVLASNVYSQSERDQAERSVIVSQNAARALENQQATLEAKRSRLNVASELAKVQLQKANLDLSRTEIRAPVDGVIVRDSVEQGSYVQKGSPLFVVEDTSRAEVRCNLQMDELYWLWHQDAPATVTDDPGGAAYQVPVTPATVSYEMTGLSKVKYTWQGELRRYDGIGVDERTRTVPCRVVVDDPRKVLAVNSDAVNSDAVQDVPVAIGPPALVRGMYVTVKVHARPNLTFVKIPDVAVQPGNRTWRVRDGKLERIESLSLVKHIQAPNEFGVLEWYWLVPSAESGIKEGDQLVITPTAGMKPGMAVLDTKKAESDRTDSSD